MAQHSTFRSMSITMKIKLMLEGEEMKHSAYLFDFDGTLVDSMPYWSAAMISVLEACRVKFPENIIEIITPLGYGGSAKYFIDELGVKASLEELIRQMHAAALLSYRDIIPIKEGVREYLLEMKEKGHSLNVLTASPHEALDICLKRLDIFDLFDNIWSCEDFFTTKSDPQIYIKAAEKMGVEIADVAFFDDNINSVRTAKQAGAYTIGVYDATGDGFREELINISDCYIESMKNADEY